MVLNTTVSQIQGQERERQTPSASRWRVSDLLLDTRRQRVWRDSREIALPKLTYDLLITLVRLRPAVLSDDDLIRTVWPGLVVSQETVSQRVKLLRAALGDDARNPRYVARLRGRGYHLVGKIDALPDDDEISIPGGFADADADAALTALDELAILDPEWQAGNCDRPEWATTQVIPEAMAARIFPAAAAPAACATAETTADLPEVRAISPSRLQAWAAIAVAAAIIAVLIAWSVLPRPH